MLGNQGPLFSAGLARTRKSGPGKGFRTEQYSGTSGSEEEDAEPRLLFRIQNTKPKTLRFRGLWERPSRF